VATAAMARMLSAAGRNSVGAVMTRSGGLRELYDLYPQLGAGRLEIFEPPPLPLGVEIARAAERKPEPSPESKADPSDCSSA
jgi:hypothetical protein